MRNYVGCKLGHIVRMLLTGPILFIKMISKQCTIPLAHQLLVLPCGAAIQLARKTKLGDTLCRDGYHLNYVYGRYTAACVWYEYITGKDVRKNKYRNTQMTGQQRRWTQKSAHQAIQNAKNALF